MQRVERKGKSNLFTFCSGPVEEEGKKKGGLRETAKEGRQLEVPERSQPTGEGPFSWLVKGGRIHLERSCGYSDWNEAEGENLQGVRSIGRRLVFL